VVPLSSMHFIHTFGAPCRHPRSPTNASPPRVHRPAARRPAPVHALRRWRRGPTAGVTLASGLGAVASVRSAPTSAAPSSSSTPPCDRPLARQVRTARTSQPPSGAGSSRGWCMGSRTCSAGGRVLRPVRRPPAPPACG
jgi:hypothetical protein